MLIRAAKSRVKRIFNRLGFDLVRLDPRPGGPPDDIDEAAKRLYNAVRPYTMSGVERVTALSEAARYIANNRIPGDMVECGVWKGGSMMAVAKTLLAAGAADRRLHLFDTFEGMTPPTAADVNFRGHEAGALLDSASDAKATTNIWAVAPLDAVKEAMQSTGYDPRLVEYMRGPVEQTLPARARQRSRCCGWTPIGTSPPITNWFTYTRDWSQAAS